MLNMRCEERLSADIPIVNSFRLQKLLHGGRALSPCLNNKSLCVQAYVLPRRSLLLAATRSIPNLPCTILKVSRAEDQVWHFQGLVKACEEHCDQAARATLAVTAKVSKPQQQYLRAIVSSLSSCCVKPTWKLWTAGRYASFYPVAHAYSRPVGQPVRIVHV